MSAAAGDSSARARKTIASASPDLDALARDLAPRVAREVLGLLARALGAAEAPYSTRRGYAPPEFSGRPKAWRRVAPTIPGAARIGRWVSVPRPAYVAWLTSHGAPVIAPATGAANDATATAWDPLAALADAGLRPSRGG